MAVPSQRLVSALAQGGAGDPLTRHLGVESTDVLAARSCLGPSGQSQCKESTAGASKGRLWPGAPAVSQASGLQDLVWVETPCGPSLGSHRAIVHTGFGAASVRRRREGPRRASGQGNRGGRAAQGYGEGRGVSGAGRGSPRLSVTWYASRRSFIRKPMTPTKSSTSLKSSLALGPIWRQGGVGGQGASEPVGTTEGNERVIEAAHPAWDRPPVPLLLHLSPIP